MKKKSTLTMAAILILSPLIISGLIHFLKKRDARIEINSNRENNGDLILKDADK